MLTKVYVNNAKKIIEHHEITQYFILNFMKITIKDKYLIALTSPFLRYTVLEINFPSIKFC